LQNSSLIISCIETLPGILGDKGIIPTAISLANSLLPFCLSSSRSNFLFSLLNKEQATLKSRGLRQVQ